MPLGLGGNLKRLQLTIGFITARFKALIGIVVIWVFIEVLDKAIPSILPRDYLKGMVKTIVAAHRIVMISLKDLLLQ